MEYTLMRGMSLRCTSSEARHGRHAHRMRSNKRHTYEMHTHRMHACGIHAREKARERNRSVVYTSLS
jgi:hypothetical protein